MMENSPFISMHAMLQYTWPHISSVTIITWFITSCFRQSTLARRLAPLVILSLIVGCYTIRCDLLAFTAPILGTLSGFSIVIILFYLFSGLVAASPPAIPGKAWWLFIVTCFVLLLDHFALIPWNIHAWGYASEFTLIVAILVASWVTYLLWCLSSHSMTIAIIALIPLLLWRFELGPSSNLWENYLDFPLLLYALYSVLKRT